jgi:neutral ceramidase
LAIVQCDLLGGSSVVQHLVARAVEERTDVPLAGLMIGATHTHAGPGQFLGTNFYNRFASNRSGFDPAWTAFLVERISDAVESAVATRRPARMAVGTTEVWGLTRNRSLLPHVNNDDVADKRTEPQRKFVSINPELHLVRVDAKAPDGGQEPLAAMVVFSVHGTGISVRARDYNADLWAYLVGELGHRIQRRTGARPVVGAIEGTHADIAPALRPGTAGHLEAQRLGQAIGAEAADLYDRLEGRLTDDVQLGVGLREVDLGHDRSIAGTTLPRRPAVGAALVAGAYEHTTPVVHKIPPFAAGHPKRRLARGPHGRKWVIGSRFLQPLVLPLRDFPRVLPVQVIRLADVMLVGLPFEVTTESGRRIARSVADASGPDGGIDRVVVSSVANEYSGYVATAEEYELQYYEGGHTLYGPRTQAFLAGHAASLTGGVVRHGSVQEGPSERTWDLRVHRYLPRPEPSDVVRQAVGVPTFTDPTREQEGSWRFEWLDVAPGNLDWHEPMVVVEQSDGSDRWEPATHHGRPVDDQGWALGVVHLGAVDKGPVHRYAVDWHDPAFRAGRQHRFVVLENSGRPVLHSPAFD